MSLEEMTVRQLEDRIVEINYDLRRRCSCGCDKVFDELIAERVLIRVEWYTRQSHTPATPGLPGE